MTPKLTWIFNGRQKCLFQRKGGSLEEIGAIFAYCLPIPFPGLQVNTSTEAKIEELPASFLTKAEATVTPTRKKKKAFSRKGSLALCQQQKTYVSNKLKMLYNYLISIDHSSTHVHLFRAGESKKMKGQLACTWTAFESQDVQTFYPRKYKTEILPDLWTVTPRNIKIPRSEVIFQFGAIFSVSGSSIFQHFLF